MGGSHLLNAWNSSQAYRMKRLTAYIPTSVKRYSEGKNVHDDHERHVHEERAPSTAEEFRRVAEEKSRQGPTNHTPDGAQKEPTTGDSDVEPVEEKLKEPPGIGPTS